jgi:hypothetical protein
MDEGFCTGYKKRFPGGQYFGRNGILPVNPGRFFSLAVRTSSPARR